MSLRSRLIPFALLAVAPAAAAQTAAGDWKFETGQVAGICRLSGDMEISKPDAHGASTCRFVAKQSCPGDPPLEFSVQQSCSVARSGKKVEITSRIERVLSVKPDDFLDTVKRGYAPDNFSVRLNASGTEMSGLFHSKSVSTVRFWRPNSDLVS
ncbi:MAG: hypothetical protein GC155_10410 [Alphaproteobacteria bacterium]|nr:hypothetical protein [Alphaproteobacteria bacterium]